MNKPTKTLFYIGGCIIIVILLAAGIWLIASRPITKSIPVFVRSDIPGFSFKIQNQDILNQFLNEYSLREYSQNNQKVKKLEIVLTSAPQPLYQYNKDNKTVSSYSFAFNNGVITELIQIDPQIIFEQKELSATIQQYFLYMVYDFIIQAKPDFDAYMRTNLGILFFTARKI
jgi:hypothetical protein